MTSAEELRANGRVDFVDDRGCLVTITRCEAVPCPLGFGAAHGWHVVVDGGPPAPGVTMAKPEPR
jgi:hypothetical protein